MAGKKRLNKNKNIAVVVIVLFVIIGGIFAIWSYQKENAKINEINKFLYDSLSCISNCSVQLMIGQNSTSINFDDACMSECKIKSVGKYPDFFIKSPINSKNEGKLITASPEFLACKSIYNEEGNADKYKACLIEILPGLKEKFGIK